MEPAANSAEEETQRRLTQRPSTCLGKTCDERIAIDGTTCEESERLYFCDCSGCTCPGPATFAPTPADLSQCYTFNMDDSYGDGWNGAVWTWREEGEGGRVLKTGTLATGASGTAALCPFADVACYEFEVDAGSMYPYEISWAVNLPDGGDTLWEGVGRMPMPPLPSPRARPTRPARPSPRRPSAQRASGSMLRRIRSYEWQ